MEIIRKPGAIAGTFRYLLTGEINGESYGSKLARTSRSAYTHASLTRVPTGVSGNVMRDVLTFHKSAAAARRGNADLRKYAISIRVIEITDQED